MYRKIVLAAVFVLAPLTGGQAQVLEMCVEPVAPMPVDGNSVTVDQLRAAMAEARDFIAESDVYQNCLVQEVEAAKAQAVTDGKPFDQSIEADAKIAIANSQKAKEKAGAAVNNAVVAYKQVH